MANLSWPQRTTLVAGALLALWGLADLVAGGAALGVVHLVTGLAILAAAFRVRAIRLLGALMGVVFLVVFVFGISGGALDAGVLGNGAHLLLGFGSVAVAESCVWCERRARTFRARGVERLP